MRAIRVIRIVAIGLLLVGIAVAVGAGISRALKGDSIDGSDFATLGYVAAVLALALVAVWLLVGRLEREATGRSSLGDAIQGANIAANDRVIILSQLWVGAALITVGAAAGIFVVLLGGGDDEFGLAIATAVIGAGAALLPPGAASSASTRILETLPRQRLESGATVRTNQANLAGAVVPAEGTTVAAAFFLLNKPGEPPTQIAVDNPLAPAATASLLDAATDYEYRLVVVLGSGEVVAGDTVPFKTPTS
jgi:hypothetical protein